MKGTNIQRPPEKHDGKQLWVHSMFRTIQGEGPLVGKPAVFLRLGGCNLACHWCDTEFEEGAKWMSVLAILEEADRCWDTWKQEQKLLVITGGEPLRQEIRLLCKIFLSKHWAIQIETSGSMYPSQGIPVSSNISIVCSPKTPRIHPKVVEIVDCWKYVLEYGKTSQIDGLPNYHPQANCKSIKAVQRPPQGTAQNIYVMPCDVEDPQEKQRNEQETVRIALKYGYRLCFQMHKIWRVE